MIIPVRCFTCGNVVGDKYSTYLTLTDTQTDSKTYSEAEALDALGMTRYCCRRMFLTHVDFSDQLLKFNPADNAIQPEEILLAAAAGGAAQRR
jgi:DNA-directed RNA polymerase I, II, and III subunit RPABC5